MTQPATNQRRGRELRSSSSANSDEPGFAINLAHNSPEPEKILWWKTTWGKTTLTSLHLVIAVGAIIEIGLILTNDPHDSGSIENEPKTLRKMEVTKSTGQSIVKEVIERTTTPPTNARIMFVPYKIAPPMTALFDSNPRTPDGHIQIRTSKETLDSVLREFALAGRLLLRGPDMIEIWVPPDCYPEKGA